MNRISSNALVSIHEVVLDQGVGAQLLMLLFQR